MVLRVAQARERVDVAIGVVAGEGAVLQPQEAIQAEQFAELFLKLRT